VGKSHSGRLLTILGVDRLTCLHQHTIAVVLHQGAVLPAPHQPVTPAPWLEVLLTIFPGCWWLVGIWYTFLSLHIWQIAVPTPVQHFPGSVFAGLGMFGTILDAMLLGWLVFVLLRMLVRQLLDPAALPLVGLTTALLAMVGLVFPLALLAAWPGWGVPALLESVSRFC
jgi:hypothetical protein